MRKIYLLLPFLLSFALLTCEKEPDPPPPPPTLDQRLVGGRWYFPDIFFYDGFGDLTPKTSDGYYKFTEDGKLEYSSETTYNQIVGKTLSGKIAYSSNGNVYIKESNKIVIKYNFPSTFPYSNDQNFQLADYTRLILNKLASKGDLITYGLYNGNTIYSDSRLAKFWFLVRFNDDGTPYRNYKE